MPCCVQSPSWPVETAWKTPADLAAIPVGNSMQSQNGKVCNMSESSDDVDSRGVSMDVDASSGQKLETATSGRLGAPHRNYPSTITPGIVMVLPGRMGPHRLTRGMFSFGDRRLPDAFWRRVITEPMSGCWLWLGPINTGGYAEFSVGSYGQVRGHRIAYITLVGEVPKGLELDHLCRTRSCVNPDHLEPVTAEENRLRGARGLTTHCLRGHEFSPENTCIRTRPDGRTVRMCRMCNKIRHRKERPDDIRRYRRKP